MKVHARTGPVAAADLEKMLGKVPWLLGEVSLYGRLAFGRWREPTALRATHSPTTSQADDMSTGQLFGCANHHEQERHDELISMMC